MFKDASNANGDAGGQGSVGFSTCSWLGLCRDLAIPCCLVQMPMMESSMQFGLQTPGKGWYIVTEAALRAKLHQKFLKFSQNL